MKKLTQEKITQELEQKQDWNIIDNAIERDFEFKDFNEAFAFLSRVALLSESVNHHAEWSGVYNKVKLRLSTHDSSGITKKDTDMANEINSYIQ